MALALAAALSLAACGPWDPDRVDAKRYDAFWLWAGVKPQPVLDQAKAIYLLDGEIRTGRPTTVHALRSDVPRVRHAEVWLVVRTDTLDWPAGATERLVDRLDRWAEAGNRVQGLQVDFDAFTRGIGGYAQFLQRLRSDLPPRYRLSITGLLDWSANGDPRALAALKGVADEVVIQTYQGRGTIPGYERYFDRMGDFPVPFRVGLVQDGRWREPASLRRQRQFKGYVVFLLNPR